MTTILIDGDIVAHRCAASCEATKGSPNTPAREEAPLDVAIQRLDELCYRICNDTQATRTRIFLSGSENFRYDLYADYKANRRNIPKPRWLEPCREFLVREWGAEVTNGYEADDGIGIAHSDGSIICSIDKDLWQIPGLNYNFVTSTFLEISEEDAALNLWAQVLKGDRTDNIPGLAGIGDVKARRAVSGLSGAEAKDRVRELYGDERAFLLNYRLIKILRSLEEYHRIVNELREGQGQEAPTGRTGLDSENLPGADGQ